MLPRTQFVHTLHILKAFQREIFFHRSASIEWLIPNLIFRAILGNAD